MPDEMPNSLNPTALPIDVAAKVLSKSGGCAVTEAMLRNDLDSGAPVNADGTLNLVNYAAWLIKELSQRGD